VASRALLLGVVLLALLRAPEAAAMDFTLTGSATAEGRVFLAAPALPGQDTARLQPSGAAELDAAFKSIVDGLSCVVNPYGRYDAVDPGRRLLDPHVVKCRLDAGGGAFELGYDVQFWGVMEFVNPANVLNQRDLTEDLVTKRRLGAPMASFVWPVEGGTVEAYVLEYSPPVRLPSAKGRLRPSLPVDGDAATYGSRAGRARPEAALRSTRTLGPLSLALSYFNGYAREPDVSLVVVNMAPSLLPSYRVENQLALEAQLTLGGLILKSEDAVRLRSSGGFGSYAVAVGAEYDLAALWKGSQSLSLLAEYDRDDRTRSLLLPFTNDAFAGARLGLNDQRSTELAAWASFSLTDRELGVVAVDASTRIVDGLKVALGYRQIVSTKGPWSDLASDDYLSLRLGGYF
jgi:hypothetical protein